MPVVSQTLPNFNNGVSQQAPTQRLTSQASEQINMENNLLEGLGKRPPLEFVATLDGSNVFPNTTKIWSIKRDEDNQYLVAIYNNGVKVYDLDGNEKTVSTPDGTSYLASTNPKENFKLVNIADFTFIANQSITPAADSSTSAAKVEEFLVYVKQAAFGREYSVRLTHPDITGVDYIEVNFQMPDGSNATHDTEFSDTDKIADLLLYGQSSVYWNGSSTASIAVKQLASGSITTLSTTTGLANTTAITNHFTFESYASTIYGKPTDGDANYTVTTRDGAGGTAMYAIRDTIEDFTRLPFYSKTGVIIQVTGETGDNLTDYFVAFSSDGIWNETVGPGVSVGLDDTTMPHVLVNNNDGTFTFRKQTYSDRIAGDLTTNPNPSFVGKKIQNLTFYKNRLGILSGENLILSGNADFFNFFSTTATQVLDTDVIDISASGTQVNTLKNSVSFNESLLLFSDTAQYKLTGAQGNITPTTAILNEVSSFEHDDAVTPVSAGRFAYFTQKRENFTGVREYFSNEDTLTNDGVEITLHVSSYIPNRAYQIIPNSNEDMLFVLTSDAADAQTAPYATGSNVTATNASKIFVYKYFRKDGLQKVQSAWSTWTFTGVKILGGMTVDSILYLFVAEGQTTKLCKIDLKNTTNTTIGFNVHLDLRDEVTGTYSSGTGLTTFTSPYGAKTGLIAVNRSTGANYTVTNTSGSTYTLEGNYTSLYIGVPYESAYTMSPQYIRQTSTTGGVISITSGRLQIRNVSFDFRNSAYFQVEVTPSGRDTSIMYMNGYIVGFSGKIDTPQVSDGTLRVPVQARNTDYTLVIKSSSHLPFFVTGAEIEGYYHRRSRQV
jgi:hypothetical protein